MNYQIEELTRGMGQGKISIEEGKQLINDYIDLQVRLAKLTKPMYNDQIVGQAGLKMPSNG